MCKKIIFAFIVTLSLGNYKGNAQTINWTKADSGLHIGMFISPIPSTFGNSEITIVKINPKIYDFHIVSAKDKSTNRQTIENWCKSEGFIGAVNAGMFNLTDRLTNVGYLKNKGLIHNPNFKSDYCSFLCFDPKVNNVPPVQIVEFCSANDPQRQIIEKQYGSMAQSLRMLNRQGVNVWAQSPDKLWSMVVWAMDQEGNVLWIFTRSPFTVHTFINILKQAPLKLYNMMYLEGGPEASLYFNHQGITLRKIGNHVAKVYERETNHKFWRLPNVIGIKKK